MPHGIHRTSAIALVCAALLAAFGCAHDAPATASGDTLIRFAPPPDGAEIVRMTALLEGRLRYRDGCFRVDTRHAPEGGTRVIWPHDYVAVERRGHRGVMASDGRTVLEGDHVRLGGGAVDTLHDRIIGRDRAARCGGPYTGAYLPD